MPHHPLQVPPMKRSKSAGTELLSPITPRYRDLFQTMCDTDQKRVDSAFDAVLFDRKLAVPALVEQYYKASNNQLRYFCVQLLGFSDSKKALPVLIDALEDPIPAIRIEALYALEDHRCADAIPAIVNRTNDIDTNVRQIAQEVCDNLHQLSA